MAFSFETLSVSIQDHIAEVELNRPTKANAMNEAMWRELQQCFEALDAASEVRVVILTGAGDHFCSGMDLSVFAGIPENFGPDAGRNSENLRLVIKNLQGNLTAIERCRKPVIAAIHSSCIGGAIDMITCCDMRYCSNDAVFSVKETEIGMTADVGTLQRLPRLVGDGIARELAYTARNCDAAEAQQIGLVNRVFASREAMLTEVRDIARSIAEKSPLAIRGTKEMILYTRDHSVEDGLNYIATWNAAMLMSKDLEKSVTAMFTGDKVEYDD